MLTGKWIQGALACFFLCAPLGAQEVRSMLFGRVLDQQGASVVGATVVVRNTDTGLAITLRTNDQGYYEANLLMPGTYELAAEMPGFKRLIRGGVTLPVSSRIEVNLRLEVGGVTETISVTADAPLLETNAVSTGRVLDNKTVMELPVMGNSAMLLVKLTPGVQYGGVNNYLALHSNAGGSDYNVAGNIGGNMWTLDGAPNQGPGRRTAFLPYTDAVAEFKVETNNFDAGIGQTSGAAISMISKSGTNEYHGTMTWQHWQQRWQGTPFFVKQNYYRRIAQAEAAGNTALANDLRSQDKQPTGRSNNWGASGGGPVSIPKLYDGRNKLFWFFTYNAFKDVKVEDAAAFNRTVPTLRQREGDFSEGLALPNAIQHTIFDPITIMRDPARPNNFIRTMFPNNVIPRSRMVNPAYNRIRDFYPLPNVAIPSGLDPVNNYLASQTPYNWDYYAYSNRVDYNLSDKWRMFGRWSINNFGPEDRGDWTYETARGMNLNGLVRNNKGGNVDVIYTQSPTTFWNLNVAMNQFREGNVRPFPESFKPSEIGLPSYLDQKAGALTMLPQMNVTGMSTISPGGVGVFTRTRIMTAKLEMTHIRGKHTLRAAFDNRNMFRAGGGGGNTSGNFVFNNQWTRRNDDGNTPAANLSHGWAAFALGIPASMAIATNDTFAMHNPYYGWFIQDTWRVTPKLTLNLGLRNEYERGPTERYDRMIGAFDASLPNPLARAAEANYAANPIPELPASQFRIAGGNTYVGVNGAPRQLYRNEFMWLPRIGVAYSLDNKTVLRGGYGVFFDTINVLNFGPNQFGYSRTTNTIMTNDFGQSWNFTGNASPNNGGSPLNDPFPVRADGSRFDEPTRNGLGSMAVAGRGYSYTDFNQPHARQQRWQAGMQRQFGANWVLTATYAGSYSDRISISTREDFLPEQFWADGLVRNNAIATNMNANVPNPFRVTLLNRADYDPLVWTDLNSNAFFTQQFIRKHQLLRGLPLNSSGLNNTKDFGYWTRTNEIQLTMEKRFAAGWNLMTSYTGMHIREADFLFNEWDPRPTRRVSNDGRPHRFITTGIYELPFGKGKPLAANVNKAGNLIIGGWQLASTLEWQPGPLVDFGSNVWFYGSDLSQITNVQRSFETWFNTADFERVNANGPNAFHRRMFPPRIDDLRRDHTLQWNANVSKNLPISERWNLQLRLDALNVLNRSQMNAPVTDPFSTNFGRIVSQTSATNRWIQVQARLTF